MQGGMGVWWAHALWLVVRGGGRNRVFCFGSVVGAAKAAGRLDSGRLGHGESFCGCRCVSWSHQRCFYLIHIFSYTHNVPPEHPPGP